MGQLAIVNAPSSFTLIWSIIKPWLSKETAEKVDILGSDYQEQLLKLVDADCLPSTLGGTCECEDKGGCQLSGAGPWLDGRVGWGPNAKPCLSADRLNAQDVADASVVEASGEDLKDFVLSPNSSTLVQPKENGKIHGLEVDNEADGLQPEAPIDSSSLKRSDQENDNSQENDSLGAQKSQG